MVSQLVCCWCYYKRWERRILPGYTNLPKLVDGSALGVNHTPAVLMMMTRPVLAAFGQLVINQRQQQ